jgi:hypothetical protein
MEKLPLNRSLRVFCVSRPVVSFIEVALKFKKPLSGVEIPASIEVIVTATFVSVIVVVAKPPDDPHVNTLVLASPVCPKTSRVPAWAEDRAAVLTNAAVAIVNSPRIACSL